MIFQAILFVTGIFISAVAAYYSIVGLTAIFAGSFWPIVIMGSALEIGKLVAVSWLYHNWYRCPILLKTYLCSAIAILMIITSMGIFGFLSRAHLEQQITNSGVPEQIQILDTRILNHREVIKDIDIQIGQIDKAISDMKGRSSTRLIDEQRKNRDDLIKRKLAETKSISDLTIERIKLETETKKIEAEVGPIKYVAEIIYGSSETAIVDKAIRLVILLLIVVFDPLAVLLLVAFNISLKKEPYGNIEFVEIVEKNLPSNKKRRRRKTVQTIDE